MALTLLARALDLDDRPVQAQRAIQAALRLEPEMHDGYVVLTDVMISLDNAYRAEKAAREAVRLAPADWVGHYCLARAMATGRLPRWRDALGVALHAVNLAPHSASAHNLTGVCFNALNDRRQARMAFEEALRLEPDHVEASANLAALDANSGRLRRGARRVTAALGQRPSEEALHEVLDHLVLKFCIRLFFVVLIAAVALGIEVSVGVPWLVRAATGVLLVAVVSLFVRAVARHLPRGISRWSPETLRRVHRNARGIFVLLALALVTLFLLSLAPAAVARSAGLVLLTLLLWFGLMVTIGLVIGALTNLVRGR